MVRSDIPNPYRIPSTVFESRSPTPSNWSVASNESLFSIHVGNSSFSKDHVFLLGRSGDLSSFPSSPPNAQPSQSTVVEPDTKKEVENGFGDQGVTAEAANATAMNDVLSAVADVPVDKKKPQVGSVRCSTSTSRHSDASTHSFAFPILAEGDGSIKVEPESQTQQQVKAAEDKEAPKVTPDAANSKWFPCLSCSFCC